MSSSAPVYKCEASSKPWKSWPFELPPIEEIRQTPALHKLLSLDTRRELHQEIRANAWKVFSTWAASSPNSALILAGGTSEDFELYDTDVEKCEFRQEHMFRYLFGVNEPDLVGAFDLDKKEVLLFVPHVDDDAQRWNGPRRELSWYSQTYGVDHTFLTSDIDKVLTERGIKLLYTVHGLNLDSGNCSRTKVKFDGMDKYKIDSEKLYPALVDLRLYKTPKEIDILRIGNIISSQAHVYVMRHIHAGLSEMQLEARYKAWCHFHGGSRHMAYTCICGSGAHGSILHYGHAGRPNDRILQDGDSVVLDMGAEYIGYSTDITRSYPINGKFTADQKIVHDAVYEAQKAVLLSLKPGVQWQDMHRLAEKVILEHLLKAGIVQNGTVEEMQSVFLGAVFMPHGLGHLLGLATHDVGGYEAGCGRAKEPGVGYLRLGRKLAPGMIVTVEPGLYFNDHLLDKALANPAQAKFINAQVLQRFRGTGGCRLEDDVLITEDGCENLTVLPTSTEEIEEVVLEAVKIRDAANKK